MKGLVEKWKASLLDEVRYDSFKGGMNFYLCVFNQSLARRFLTELDASIKFHDSGSYLCSYSHARSLIETTSLMLSLANLMSKGSRIHVDEIKKIGFGGREECFSVQQTSILTTIEKLNKEHDGIKRIYEQLCEFTHPNFRGVIGYYADLDDGGDIAAFGKEKPRLVVEDYSKFISNIIVSACNYFNENNESIKDNVFNKVVGP